MSQLSYRNFRSMRWTDVDRTTPRFIYPWNGARPSGKIPQTAVDPTYVPGDLTVYDPTYYNNIQWPTPGLFHPQNNVVWGGSTTQTKLAFTTAFGLNTAIAPRAALLAGAVEIDPTHTGAGAHWVASSGSDNTGFGSTAYITDTFSDPYRLGFTVEYWAYTNRAFYNNGRDNPAVLTIGAGPSINPALAEQSNPTAVPMFRVGYNATGLGATTDAPSGVMHTNTVICRVGGRVFTTPAVADFTDDDIGYADGKFSAKALPGWHHIAVVEDKVNTSFRIYIDGVAKAIYSGVNMNIPVPTVSQSVFISAQSNTSPTVGVNGNSSMVIADLTINKYPKYSSNFVAPNITNFTTP